MEQTPNGPLPRLLVFDTPGVEELKETLTGLFPGTEINTRVSETLGDHEPSIDVLSVWHISWEASKLKEKATDLLRQLVYPLATRRGPFVVSFAVDKEVFTPEALSTTASERLDLEDLLRLLAPDSAAVQSFDSLHLLGSHMPQTPIEDALAKALQKQGIDVQPQARVGRFIVDFMVEKYGRRWAIEADGQAFHDADQDALRDKELAGLGIEEVIHFTGSEIHRDATACARRAGAIIEGADGAPQNIRKQQLDDSQRLASTHSSGAARVLAPAGSGKTRVLVERVAELVRGGIEPSSILVLAFNTKANEQLIAQLDELGVPTSPKRLFDESVAGVRCATFNAFGYRFQKEHLGLNFNLEKSDGEWRALMKRAAENVGVTLKGTKRGSDPIGELLRARERAAADLVDPDEIEVEFETFDDKPSRVVAYGEIDREFERMRVDRQILSYSDMLTTTVQQLLSSPEAREFAQEYFTHVLVDEFQDLSAAQLATVDIISRPSRDLFVVGDDDQLIYGWRYAKVTNILEFEKRVPSAETYVLSTNYRSSASVVKSARRVIDHNKVRIAKDIQPRAGAPAGEVRYAASDSLSQRSEEVTTFIQVAKERCDDWRKIAVLCRYKSQQPIVAAALDRAGIPRSPMLTYRLFSDSNMKLLRHYLELVRNPETLDGDSLALVINRPNRFATNELLNRIRASKIPWTDFNRHLDDSPEGDAFRTKALRGFRERAQMLQIFSGEKAEVESLIDNIVRDFDLERFWQDEKPNGRRDQDEASPMALLDLIRLYAAEASDIDSFLAEWDRRQVEEIERADSADDNLAREQAPDQDRVVVSTMHASKGREYQAVVIFDYAADLDKLNDVELEEERRVFYVGMTRAQDSLLITTDSNKRLHRFVRESIAPAAPDERHEIGEKLRSLDEPRRQATIDLARAQDRLTEIQDGREMARLENQLAQVREPKEGLLEEINELTERLAGARVWHTVSGRKRRTEQELAEIRGKLAIVENDETNLDDETTFLRADSSRYAEPFEREVTDAERRISDLDQEVRSLHDRLSQLRLIGA